jgi:hypothetical protein
MFTSADMSQKDLLEVVPPFNAQGSSAMVRVLELPPGDPGIARPTPSLRPRFRLHARGRDAVRARG